MLQHVETFCTTVFEEGSTNGRDGQGHGMHIPLAI